MCSILNVLQVTSLSWIPMECNIAAGILQKVLGGITVSNWICCKQGHIMASKSHLIRSFSLKLICEGCWRLWVCYLLHTIRVFLSWSLQAVLVAFYFSFLYPFHKVLNLEFEFINNKIIIMLVRFAIINMCMITFQFVNIS